MKKRIAFITDSHLYQQLIQSDSEEIVYGDVEGANLQHLDIALEDAKSKQISTIVFGGDIGTKASHEVFFSTVKKYSNDFSMILGNHDNYNEVKRYYPQKSATESTLDFSKEDLFYKYVFMDSSAGLVEEHQLQWLSQEIKTDKRMILFIHHPVLEIATKIEQIGAALQNRDELLAVLKTATTPPVIFCGHYHMNDERIQDGIQQFCTIATSYEIEKEKEVIKTRPLVFGYRVIELEDGEIRTWTQTF